MIKMGKRMVCVICCCILICNCFGMKTVAAEGYPVPLWDNVDRLSCNISFSGTKGTVLCDIDAISDTTSIKGTLVLYEDNSQIKKWDIDVTTSYVTILESFTGVKGRTYKLVLAVNVVANGASEPLNHTATKTCK